MSEEEEEGRLPDREPIPISQEGAVPMPALRWNIHETAPEEVCNMAGGAVEGGERLHLRAVLRLEREAEGGGAELVAEATLRIESVEEGRVWLAWLAGSRLAVHARHPRPDGTGDDEVVLQCKIDLNNGS